MDTNDSYVYLLDKHGKPVGDPTHVLCGFCGHHVRLVYWSDHKWWHKTLSDKNFVIH